ncbi:MAG TPA: HyaD/HybD family hydrogenase maturation endopeptidase [Terriglobia bacterium]|nr:HyaD/HybD family hydrogenase maturation endopeptidase [Terriglobia bacterium]
MREEQHPTTVVLALGNLIRSDDAVGIFALQRLQEDPRVPADVSLLEGGTKGMELVPYVSEASRLLVLDAVEVGAPAGTILRLAGEDIRSLPGGGSVHELALADILGALRILGCEPKEVVLLGVQPARTELGTSLSPPVEAALPALVDAAVVELKRWESCPTLRPAACKPPSPPPEIASPYSGSPATVDGPAISARGRTW